MPVLREPQTGHRYEMGEHEVGRIRTALKLGWEDVTPTPLEPRATDTRYDWDGRIDWEDAQTILRADGLLDDDTQELPVVEAPKPARDIAQELRDDLELLKADKRKRR